MHPIPGVGRMLTVHRGKLLSDVSNVRITQNSVSQMLAVEPVHRMFVCREATSPNFMQTPNRILCSCNAKQSLSISFLY